MLRAALVLLLSVFALAPPSHAQDGTASDPVTLRPGDVVRVAIWREEDLSGDFPVNERGVVVLPLLGEQNVTGIPLERLREVLITAYREQLRNPSIQITPLRRVMVLGEVAKPGIQEVDPTITLAGAVALAGGPTSNGDMRKIRVVRGDIVLQERAAVQSQLSSMDIRSGDQIFVGSRSWLERNSTLLLSSALSVTLFFTTLILNRSGSSGDDSGPEHEPKSPTEV